MLTTHLLIRDINSPDNVTSASVNTPESCHSSLSASNVSGVIATLYGGSASTIFPTQSRKRRVCPVWTKTFKALHPLQLKISNKHSARSKQSMESRLSYCAPRIKKNKGTHSVH